MRESPEELRLKPPSISRVCSSRSAATVTRGAPISMPEQAIGSNIQAAITLTTPGAVSM